VALHDALAHRQPDARPFVLVARVQAPEHLQDARGVRGRHPDAVVRHAHQPAVVLPLRTDPHLGRHTGPRELERVADQVLEELAELRRVAVHRPPYPHHSWK